MPVNKVLDLDFAWINTIEVNNAELSSKLNSSKFMDKTVISEKHISPLIIKAIQCVDLTLLVGDETPEIIAKLCNTAALPLEEYGQGDVAKIVGAKAQCAAVCVYPLRIQDACKALAVLGATKSLPVAAVAAGFPSGQFPLHTRLAEIYYAVAAGAQEIDVVIDRSLVLRGLWSQLYQELAQMREACGEATLKVILSVSECGSLTNVYKASVVAMLAGADFIKTSTGKEAASMTMSDGLVMCYAIKDFHHRTGVKVGLKAAGGVRTAEQAISWLLMVKEEIGEEWVDPKLFRIGTSGTSTLVKNLVNALTS